MRVLVTGAAGFIGFHVARALSGNGADVVGYDNLNPYYDPKLKQDRLRELEAERNFSFIEGDLAEEEKLARVFSSFKPERVIHLAAQAGVRGSITKPRDYIEGNIVGFFNILEACRYHKPEHLVFASSSSVYGHNTKLPFGEQDKTDTPASLYGATKKSNEVMAYAYASLYGIAITGLRFFTVYGPWGRPDMAPFLFTKKVLSGEAIDVFNNGRHARDFTYIDDIVDGVLRVNAMSPAPRDVAPNVPFQIYNIGNNKPVELLDFIACIEKATGKKAVLNFLPMQQGDVLATFADIGAISEATGFAPKTPLDAGIERLVAWYRPYYGV